MDTHTQITLLRRLKHNKKLRRKKYMKKTLATCLGLVFAASVAMAANPFVDVPANHWAYKAVMELSRAGIVDGMGDGTFKGDKTVTRYEMAQIVAKAMTKSDKADTRAKATIQKLQAEFSAELNSLGVKVDGLKAQVDNMSKFSGEIRVRYKNEKDSLYGTDVNTNDTLERTRIGISGKINDTWTYNGRFENTQDLRTSNEYTGGSSTATNYNLAWVEGKALNGTVEAGVFEYLPAYGLTADSHMKGVAYKSDDTKNFTFGLYAGRAGLDDWSVSSLAQTGIVINTNPAKLYGAEVGAKLNESINMKGSFFQYQLDDNQTLPVDQQLWASTNTGNNFNVWEVGADAKLGADWQVKAAYAKSNVDVQNKAYIAGISYGNADKSKPGSFGADLSYQYRQLYSTYDSTLDVTPGFKGYKLGAGYVFDKNILLKGTYIDQKMIDLDDWKDKIFRTELFFYCLLYTSPSPRDQA
eukprot:TRINITY_DN34806_c0_g1_i2.p1 TRINITY_DN34806_c0_g1~~TRINITY_DN34806_c0_g1_i2.p1  ORF type:complete len:469 (+),score=46.74 TRINITY_DN34806_c0_g1_i2:330-1736(+)